MLFVGLVENTMIVISAATGPFGHQDIERLLDRVPATDLAVALRDVRSFGSG